MKAYILRRLVQFLPVALGVYGLTFLLFHLRDPLTIAGVHLPQAPLESKQDWIRAHGYHLPLFLNLPLSEQMVRADGRVHAEFSERSLFYSQFFVGLRDRVTLDLGRDRHENSIVSEMGRRIGPTLSIMIPALALAVGVALVAGLLSAYLAGSRLDRLLLLIAIVLMSLALPIHILIVNYVVGSVAKLAPIYRDVRLPILVGFLAGVGAHFRLYRSVFLEQMRRPYVTAARARGISESRVLTRHVLANSLVPVITSVGMSLPFLIAGSLLLEQFFGIPGMGSMLYDALVGLDFAVLRSFVYLGALTYLFASLVTDIAYVFVDPRIAPGDTSS